MAAYISTPIVLPGGKPLDFYLIQRGKLIEFTDDGMTLFALRCIGYQLSDKRNWRGLENIGIKFGFSLSSEGAFEAIFPDSELDDWGGRIVRLFASLAAWEEERESEGDSDFSLTEVRVLYELAHHAPCTASDLKRRLLLDAGYLSRIVRRFSTAGWITRTPSPSDARQHALGLTPEGRAVFEPLQQRSREEAARLLAPLAPGRRDALVAALSKARALLDPNAGQPARTAVLRDVRPGDMGWVVQQHGEVYAREYGWNSEFEALVAEIVAGMIRQHDPVWERGFVLVHSEAQDRKSVV